MTDAVNRISGWEQTLRVLSETLAMHLGEMGNYNADSPEFLEIEQNIAKIHEQLHTHAIAGIAQVNTKIATNSVLQEIKNASREAKREADRLKSATKTVQKLSGILDKVTKVVENIAKIAL